MPKVQSLATVSWNEGPRGQLGEGECALVGAEGPQMSWGRKLFQ